MDDHFKIVQAVFLFNERVDWNRSERSEGCYCHVAFSEKPIPHQMFQFAVKNGPGETWRKKE